MKLSEKVIRDKARKIIKEIDIQSPPIDIEKIIERHSLKIEYIEESEDYDGELIPRQRLIKINTRKPKVRQRFTLAHELGHWVLYHADRLVDETPSVSGIYDNRENNEVTRIDASSHKIREKEANIFASEILMPIKLFKKNWKELQNPEKIAKLYQVSTQAVWIRLQTLHLV